MFPKASLPSARTPMERLQLKQILFPGNLFLQRICYVEKAQHCFSLFFSFLFDLFLRFMSLSFQQKCASTMVKHSKFLLNFLATYHMWNPSMLYHIYQRRQIPNYLSKQARKEPSMMILKHLSIAWLEEPILYFDLQSEEGQNFFVELLDWMEGISNKKIFQYAHKIKDKADPQQNILWFTEKSFQLLEAWFINQLEKILIKNYYNRNNYDLDNYTKIKKLHKRASSSSHQSPCKKQIDSMLCMKINDTKNKSETDFQKLQEKVKVYEDRYYEEVALLIDYNSADADVYSDGEGGLKDQKIKKKKKKSKSKKSKKKSNQELNNEKQNDGNQEAVVEIEDGNKNDQQGEQSKKGAVIEKGMQKVESNELKNAQQEVRSQKFENECQETKLKIQEIVVDRNQNKQQIDQSKGQIEIVEAEELNNQCKISISNGSGESSSWSNINTQQKSGQSHPQLSILEYEEEVINNRSLSPESNSLKTKRKGKGKNNQNRWAKDTSKIRVENKARQTKWQEIEETEEQTFSRNDQKEKNQIFDMSEPENQQHQYKRKKRNKGPSLLKQLQTKISTSLINRQLSNFVDSLSMETNNLYDCKIVSFERIRYFIQSLFPTTQAILFGSNAVGLSLPTSDIDIMLFNLPCSCREQAIQILAHLAVQINTMGWIVSCSAYLNAKVPLVKLEIDPTVNYMLTKRRCDYMMGPIIDTRTLYHLQMKTKKQKEHKGFSNSNQTSTANKEESVHENSKIIKVDLTININGEGCLGAQSTQLMKKWMARYPQIHKVILAFKYILIQRGFSSNFKGGVGSYCLFVMIAAYIREYPHLESLDEGDFFMSTLKFYGEQFENQIKSIVLKNIQPTENQGSCFISIEQTMQMMQSSLCKSAEQISQFHNMQTNPLRIFDPINNRVMSGNCQLYSQIKAEFRRIYKQLLHSKEIVEKEVELTINGNEIPKMLQTRKSMEKWINKYELRSGFSIKDIFQGGF